MNGEDALPLQAHSPDGPYDFQKAASVAGRDIDHCFSGWSGNARIEWSGRAYALEILSDQPAAVVFIPARGNAFCVEPVPHVNNASDRLGSSNADYRTGRSIPHVSKTLFQSVRTAAG
ncbi:MAG: hypothetical protein U5J78_06715 [Parasphingorhabdus sp.]|nr:hypothetical protein [Parasphingorhabdus sp.]